MYDTLTGKRMAVECGERDFTMESTAIILRGHIGAIVRGNVIHHFFNGIYTGSSAALDNPAVAFDADIYNNRIYAIKDDAIEPEGTCVNHRFRNNMIDSTSSWRFHCTCHIWASVGDTFDNFQFHWNQFQMGFELRWYCARLSQHKFDECKRVECDEYAASHL
jgi:hypothetical protein